MSETRTFVGNVVEASVLREYAQFESSFQQKAFEALSSRVSKYRRPPNYTVEEILDREDK